MGNTKKSTPENYIKGISRKTRRLFTAEQKILTVTEALRVELPIAELCREYTMNLKSTNGIRSSLKLAKNDSKEI